MKYNIKIRAEKRKDAHGQLITDNVPLFADITYSGTRMFYFTGYKVSASDLREDTQEVKKDATGREGTREVKYTEINKRLREIKATVLLFFKDRKELSPNTREELVSILNDVCGKITKAKAPEQGNKNDFFTMFEYYLSQLTISEKRKKNIKTTLYHWQEYEQLRGIRLTFNHMTPETMRDFEYYLKNQSTKPKGKNNPLRVLSPKGVNTIHKDMAMTRAFLNFARNYFKRDGITIPYPFGADGYKVPAEIYGTPIYITIPERDKLLNIPIGNKRLSNVRDIFVFQCLTGCRVGDLTKLTRSNIQNGVLTYIPIKTKDESPAPVHVPLHPKAVEILSRYDLPDGKILPFIADQKYNEYIKELFEFAGLTRLVTRLNPTTGQPEQVRLCDIASSHIARKAFVGNLYGKVDNDIIGSMSGHVPGSKAFARYHDVSEQLKQDAINLL